MPVKVRSEYTACWVLFTGVMFHYFRCYISTIAIFNRNLSEKNPNSEIIATQIGSDTENNENST